MNWGINMKESKPKLVDMYDTIQEDMRVFADKIADVGEHFDNSNTDKDEIVSLLSEFIKSDKRLTVCRTLTNERVIIGKYGLEKISYGCKRGNRIQDISAIVNLLQEYSQDFNRIKDEILIKRIECFLNAIKHIGKFTDAYKKLVGLNSGVSVGKNVFIVESGYRGEYNKIRVLIDKAKVVDGKLVLIENDTNEYNLNTFNLNDWLAIEQVKDDIIPKFDNLEIKKYKEEFDSVVADIKNEMAPITMLESC